MNQFIIVTDMTLNVKVLVKVSTIHKVVDTEKDLHSNLYLIEYTDKHGTETSLTLIEENAEEVLKLTGY